MARSRRALEPDSSGSSSRSCFLPFVFFLGVLVTCFSFILSDWEPVDRSNIGNVKAETFLSYGPIDVVYTWVNGTDPRWKKEKEFWHKHWIASLTGQPLPVWGEEANVKGKDDSNSDNRFRDNEELRYSLRSLEKYAPWVRHIYVVTDGQIPSWLDIESPKLSIVKHRDIFANKSHLPVFSSPAIEWNLDNIPGLSDMFLYFNDDVFLGSPVRPEDFVSQAGVQKGYFAWEIPLCSNRCWESSLANGRCDKECNVTACDFDMGDCGCDVNPLDGSVTCDAEKIASILEHSPKPKMPNHLCQGMCQYYWLGNGVCDRSCNVSSCAFDGGDCRVQTPHDRHRPHVHDDEEEGMSPLIKDLYSADVETNHTLVQVPLDVNATYLNLTDAFGVNGSIWGAAHDNEGLIRFASVYETEMVLLLVFGRDSDAYPMTSSVQISVAGEDAEGTPIQLDFSIVRGRKQIENGPVQVEDAEEISGGVSTFQNTSIRPQHIRLPFGFRQVTFRNILPSSDEEVDMEHPTTTEENEEASSDVSTDDLIAVIANKLASKVPLVEIFLPFNITGKKLGDGDILNLAWHMNLRLHNDEKDIDWSDHDVCQLQVPKKKAVVPPAAVTATGENKESVAVDDSKHGSLASEGKTEDDDIGNTVGKTSDEKKLDGVQDQTQQNENTETEASEQDNGITKCRLAEDNRGIIVTVRVLTNHAHAVLSAAGAFDEEETEDESSQTSETDSTLASKADTNIDSSDVDKLMEDWKTRPQVADGQVCFYDTDRTDPWRYRYCFALAMGHYHSEEVEVLHKPTLWALLHPPKPKVVYTPYMGDDPALHELLDRCIDTTTRLCGFQPQICYPNEVPVPRPPVKDETKVDLQKQKEEEGRRLACEARKRRLAQREDREKEERAAQASGGFLGSLSRFFGNIKTAVGLGHVVHANESLDDIEYADVCGPAEEKPEVTLRDAQAHLSKDTFGDSLRFVNKLYNRAFGKPKTSDRRRVPSHMPFLLQKSIIREIKEYWTKEIQDTSAHRFRHPQDMQFSFSYFHYLINRAKIHPHTLEEVWREYLDANRNGILDENEVLTAASLAHGDAPPEDFVNEVRECVQPEKREKVREIPTAEGTLRLTESLTPHITLENLERCPSVRDALIKNVRYESKVEIMPETEVTFHMLSDNYNFAWKQMMGTRARRTKFVCINDDMKHPSTAVSQILHELFLSIWPKRSQFELPYHLKNRYAHIDEFNAAQERRQLAAAIAVVILLLLAFVFRAELRAMFGFQDIARARAASASQLTQGFQQAQDDEEQEKPKTPTSPKNKQTRKASA